VIGKLRRRRDRERVGLWRGRQAALVYAAPKLPRCSNAMPSRGNCVGPRGFKNTDPTPVPTVFKLRFQQAALDRPIRVFQLFVPAARFFDGTRSYVPANVALCPSGFFNQLLCGLGSQPMHDYMGQSDAKSQTPSDKGKGMQVFFNPVQGVCNALSSANPSTGDQGVLNQATLFHEALHGYTGDEDNTLESAFSLPVTIGESVSITYYLEGKVIPGGAQGAATCKNQN